MTATLGLLIAYAALLVGVGAWIGRRVRSAGDFFVAGRRLPAYLVFATVLAANIGAGSTVGAASLGYRDGLSAWWWNGSAALGTLLLAVWIGPRTWRMARRHGFLTLGDLLESRYGRAVRVTTSLLLWVGGPFILAAQLIGVASILQVVAGVPRWSGAAAGGAVMVLYFTAGGLLSSAWVNLVQLAVLLAGFLVVAPLAVAGAGGFAAIGAAEHLPAGFLHPLGAGGSGLMWVPLLAPAFIVSPGLIQKAWGAADERAVRLGIGASGVVLLVFALLPPLIGMVARAQHPGLASIDMALPTVLMLGVHPALGALALAAVLSAEVSSADAVLFMLSTSLSQDLYRRFVRPGATDGEIVRVARGAAIAGGVAGVSLAVALDTVVQALQGFYAILTVAFFVPVVAAVHARRTAPSEAMSAIVGGIATMVVVHVATAGAGIAGWRPNVLGLLAAAAAFLVVRAARAERA
jgi:solute:Na+ symporter, SSS family